MTKLVLFVVLTFLVAPVQSKIGGVLEKANADEEALSSEYSQKLLEAQGTFISENVPVCMNKTQTMPTSFTLVMSMSAEGKVSKSWVSDNKPFSKCFQSRAEELFRYTPPKSDLYTAIEFNIN